MIERFLDALAAARLDLSAEEVADALWLASHVRFAATPSEAPPGVAKLPPKPTGPAGPSEEGREAKKERKVPAEEARPVEVHLPASPGAAVLGRRRGRAVQSPGVPALPGALGIARSLRPFKRRVPTRRRYLLDEEATVARIAEGGPKVPVLKPAPERWLELALVVDQSPTMVLWRQTVAELLLLLECHGSFRDVRLWSLTTDCGQIRLQAGLGAGARPGNRSPRELVDPSGRRLVVVVSDCVAEAWYRGEVTAQALSIWARSGPLALLQVLPERLWPRTGLAISADAHLSGSLPGSPGHRLHVRGRRNQWRPVIPSELALPVVSLEPRPLAAWARMVAGLGGAWVPGKLLDLVTVAKDIDGVGALEPSVVDLPTAAQRVRRFRANASPTARKLAAYLAAAPLSLPVMRLVQAVMLPESRQVHLAEVFLGGLLKQVTSEVEISPEEVHYEFEDGVQDLLLNEARRSETLQVLEEVSAWLNRQQGGNRGFQAIIEDPSSTEGLFVSEGSRPFASVTAGVLKRLGLQQHQQVAPDFEQAASAGSFEEIGAGEAGNDHQIDSDLTTIAREAHELLTQAFDPDGESPAEVDVSLAIPGRPAVALQSIRLFVHLVTRRALFQPFKDLARCREIVFALGGVGSGLKTFLDQFREALEENHDYCFPSADFDPEVYRKIHEARIRQRAATIDYGRITDYDQFDLKCLLATLAYTAYHILRQSFASGIDRVVPDIYAEDPVGFADHYFVTSGAMFKRQLDLIVKHFFSTLQRLAEATGTDDCVIVLMPCSRLAALFARHSDTDQRKLATDLWDALGAFAGNPATAPLDKYSKVCLIVAGSEAPYGHSAFKTALVARSLWPIPPLDVGEVSELLGIISQDLEDKEFADTLIEWSGGSPWYVRLILSCAQYLSEAGDAGSAPLGGRVLIEAACRTAEKILVAGPAAVTGEMGSFVRRHLEAVGENLGDGQATDTVIEEAWAGPQRQRERGLRTASPRLEAFVASGLIWLEGSPWDQASPQYVFRRYPTLFLRRAGRLPLVVYRSVTGRSLELVGH